MTTFKDTDIREALRRKYTNTLTLPADFKEKMGHLQNPVLKN